LENSVDTVVPVSLGLSKVPVGIQKISKFMESLYKEELFLSLSQKLDAFLVVADDHSGEDLVAFALRPNLEVARTFLPLVKTEVLGL
jgi:hypothetical protein